MVPIPAVVSDGVSGVAVDARPLLTLGLLPGGSPVGQGRRAIGSELFARLAQEDVYSTVLGILAAGAEESARAIAEAFGESPHPLMKAYDDGLRRWHLALWQLADAPIALQERRPCDVVLALGWRPTSASMAPRLDPPQALR